MKIRKLDDALHYVEWKRSMKAYPRCNDFMLVRLRKSPEISNEGGIAYWIKMQIITKANTLVQLGSQSQV